jgi:hypothetical protein
MILVVLPAALIMEAVVVTSVVAALAEIGNMFLLGFRARYGGRFGTVPYIQAGGYKLVQVKDYNSVPLPLMLLLIKAMQAGADFLVIDEKARDDEKASWVEIVEAA